VIGKDTVSQMIVETFRLETVCPTASNAATKNLFVMTETDEIDNGSEPDQESYSL
jgi:hypothetical protein